MQVIKGIRQKEGNNNYSNLVPIGAEGKHIDMNSELNLENELKLGNDHYVEIEKGKFKIPPMGEEGEILDADRVIEYYATKEEVEEEVFPYYKVITFITEEKNEEEETTNTNIFSYLFNATNDGDILLHKKESSIKDEEKGTIEEPIVITTIDEQIDKEGN